jgi:hypothetical protein
MRTNKITLALLVLLVSSLAVSQSTPTKAWTKAVPLSGGGEGWESAIAIDAAGNSVAVWDQRVGAIDRIWAKSRPVSGAWGDRTIVSRMNPPLQTVYVFPAVRVTATGDATAVWSDVDGVWTATRSPRGAWSASQLLLPGVSSPMFAMNSKGDAALMWSTGSVRAASTTVMVMRRPAGGAWGQQESVASGAFVGSNSIAISKNGDIMVAWETFSATCTIEKCTLFNFVLHASRETTLGTSWLDSGPLTTADATTHAALTTLDPTGRAGIIYKMPGALNSMAQQAAFAPWSAATTVYTSSILMTAGLSSDSSGNATLALLDLQTATGKVVAVDGSLITNVWKQAVTLSGNDPSPNQVIYSGSDTGAGAIVWAAGNPNYTNNRIRAAVRPSKGAWTAPMIISPGGMQLAAPEAVAVNANGSVAIIFSAFNGTFSNHTEYAVNYE